MSINSQKKTRTPLVECGGRLQFHNLSPACRRFGFLRVVNKVLDVALNGSRAKAAALWLEVMELQTAAALQERLLCDCDGAK